jgi:hypothetical protein
MLDEIAGQAILKIPPSSGSCARWSDEKFYLAGIPRENRAQDQGLHEPDILGRGRGELRFIHDVREVLPAAAFDRSQAEEEQGADRRENRAKRPEHEQDLFAHR